MPDAPSVPPPPPNARPAQLVEHFFRHETGRLHGALIRLLGVRNFTLAEDVAQEAMMRALGLDYRADLNPVAEEAPLAA